MHSELWQILARSVEFVAGGRRLSIVLYFLAFETF